MKSAPNTHTQSHAARKLAGGWWSSVSHGPPGSWAADGPPRRQECLRLWTRAPGTYSSQPPHFLSLPSLLHYLRPPEWRAPAKGTPSMTKQLMTLRARAPVNTTSHSGIFKELLDSQRPRLIYSVMGYGCRGHVMGEACFTSIPLNYQYAN